MNKILYVCVCGRCVYWCMHVYVHICWGIYVLYVYAFFLLLPGQSSQKANILAFSTNQFRKLFSIVAEGL